MSKEPAQREEGNVRGAQQAQAGAPGELCWSDRRGLTSRSREASSERAGPRNAQISHHQQILGFENEKEKEKEVRDPTADQAVQ